MTGLRGKPVYVQFGCGLSAPAGWINFDASPTLRAQRLPLVGGLIARRVAPRFPTSVKYGDIVRGLPIPAASCDGVYASHVLEHLSLEDFRTALRNTFRILRPGGLFRLVMPDLEYLIGEYNRASDAQAAIRFLDGTLLGHKSRPRSAIGRLRSILGNSEHLWLWDHKSTALELEAAGFGEIRRCKFNDCCDEAFKLVEDAGRFENALSIEARRPHDE